MTVQEAIEKLKYIKYIGNGEQEYKKCSESIAIDMAIEALEKQIKLEEVGQGWKNKQKNAKSIGMNLMMKMLLVA